MKIEWINSKKSIEDDVKKRIKMLRKKIKDIK